MVYLELSHGTPPNKGLGQQKHNWWDTARAAGATPAEAAIMVAQLMQEGGRDPSKDTRGGAANYSELNLNGDLLTRFGSVSKRDLAALNAPDQSEVESLLVELKAADRRQKVVEAALTAMRYMGVDCYLYHVRAGATGYKNPDKRISYCPGVANDDTRRFGRNIANAARKLLAAYNKNPASISSDWRYAGNIPHI